MQHYKH